jgi:RNA polymerase sigma-70 factor (ECF subfamily)
MPENERRQGAERPTVSPNRDQEIPSSGPEATLATAIQADCVGNSRMSLEARSYAMSDGQLVYAVSIANESEENVSDQLLLKRVAEGHKAAMHIMFARHRLSVFRFLHRMVRNTEIAEDLASQAFLDAWRSANRLERHTRVSVWLLSIARLKALGPLFAQALEGIDQADVAGIVDAAATPEAALDRKTTNAVLRSCINKLSPAQREIIDLVCYRNKSVFEAGAILGIPHATAKSRMLYARKQLARKLVSAGFAAAAARTDIERRSPLAGCI